MNVVTLCNLIINQVAAPDEAAQSAECAGASEDKQDIVDKQEIVDTAKAKAKAKEPKAKALAKEKKASGKGGKLYGYLPIGSVSVDADQKKDGDKNPGDISA